MYMNRIAGCLAARIPCLSYHVTQHKLRQAPHVIFNTAAAALLSLSHTADILALRVCMLAQLLRKRSEEGHGSGAGKPYPAQACF